MVFIKTLVEKTSRFSTISEELVDKLRTDHEIGRVTKIIKRYNRDAVGELNFTEAIDFIIVKSSKYHWYYDKRG
jgi:hypothetical protein